MKFFTKDWYQTMQNSALGCCLEVDANAEKFSESYYRRLYSKEKKEWLSSRAEICNYLKEPFIERDEKLVFDRICRDLRQKYILNLPDSILEKVADIRVLALNHSSEPVKEMIDSFSKDCKYKTEKAIEEYEKYEAEQFSDFKPDFLKKFRFHDSFVKSMRKQGNDYHLSFDWDADDYYNTKKII